MKKELILGWVVIIFFTLAVLGSCANSSPRSTVNNDWDADGDAFDRDDYNKFIEYRTNKQISNRGW